MIVYISRYAKEKEFLFINKNLNNVILNTLVKHNFNLKIIIMKVDIPKRFLENNLLQENNISTNCRKHRHLTFHSKSFLISNKLSYCKLQNMKNRIMYNCIIDSIEIQNTSPLKLENDLSYLNTDNPNFKIDINSISFINNYLFKIEENILSNISLISKESLSRVMKNLDLTKIELYLPNNREFYKYCLLGSVYIYKNGEIYCRRRESPYEYITL